MNIVGNAAGEWRFGADLLSDSRRSAVLVWQLLKFLFFFGRATVRHGRENGMRTFLERKLRLLARRFFLPTRRDVYQRGVRRLQRKKAIMP